MEGATYLIVDEAKLTEVINRIREMDEKLGMIIPPAATKKGTDPLAEYIPKAEVRGKLLASSTLWKHERKGNLKTYAIGGKRFYKRSEIENLIQEVKK